MKHKKIFSKLHWFGKTFESLIKIAHTRTLARWFEVSDFILKMQFVLLECTLHSELHRIWILLIIREKKKEYKKVFSENFQHILYKSLPQFPNKLLNSQFIAFRSRAEYWTHLFWSNDFHYGFFSRAFFPLENNKYMFKLMYTLCSLYTSCMFVDSCSSTCDWIILQLNGCLRCIGNCALNN